MRLLLDGALSEESISLLSRCAQAAQDAEGVSLPLACGLIITDDDGIRAINREQRQKDSVTDVLSFPSLSYPPHQTARHAEGLLKQEWDTDLGACFVGDIIINLSQSQRQAEAFGHSADRELCYLLVHGIMHLFGYDHLKEDDKAIMRRMEEKALAQAGQSLVSDTQMLEMAREAMTRAYVPYSHYQVGSSLMCKDGKVYTGCNVENASFGLTNCGERTAVFKAISEGAREFTTLAIAAGPFPPWPCGACRQVLSEFAPDLRILITWGDGQVAESTLSALLPNSFSPASGVQEFLGKEHHG